MFAAVALVAYLVQPGDTLSGIGASHSASLAAVEAANPQFSDPNLIYVGQTVRIPEGSSAWQQSSGSSAWQQSSAPRSYAATGGSGSGSGSQSAPVQRSTPSSQPTSGTAGAVTQSSSGGSSGTASAVTPSSSGGSSGSSSSSLSDVPGVPASFAACVAFRESTDLQNPAANGNAYGIIPASGYNVTGTSLANQKQVFAKLYAQYGAKPWASDGC